MLNGQKNKGVIAELPQGWQKVPTGPEALLAAVGPQAKEGRANLVVGCYPVAQELSARDFAVRQLPELRNAVRHLAVVSEKDERIGGHQGFVRVQTYGHGAHDVWQLQLYTKVGNTVYTVSFTEVKSRSANARKQAHEMIARVQLPR